MTYEEFTSPENRLKRARESMGVKDPCLVERYYQLFNTTVCSSSDPLVEEVIEGYSEYNSKIENIRDSNRYVKRDYNDLVRLEQELAKKVETVYKSNMRLNDDPIYVTAHRNHCQAAYNEEDLDEKTILEMKNIPVVLFCKENDGYASFYTCRQLNDQDMDYVLIDIMKEGPLSERILEVSGGHFTNAVIWNEYIFPVYSRESTPRILNEIKAMQDNVAPARLKLRDSVSNFAKGFVRQ